MPRADQSAAPAELVTETGQPAGAEPARLGRRWWAILGAIVLWAAILQVLILRSAWADNPLARIPIQDADLYWSWAGRIAAGEWLDPSPFMSAPLYPYLLGIVRALGGGLVTMYVLQALAHVATVALLAYGAARRFGPTAGLLTAGLYTLLMEPAFLAGRVLNCSFQLLAIAVLWLALLRAQRRNTVGAWTGAGAATGLNCLLNPPMLLAVVLLAGWAWWQSGWRLRGIVHAGLLALAAALVISPATLHNYKVSGEFIPISAQAGLTFAHGNGPGSLGTYTPIPGISTNRQMQNQDAWRYYEHATGQKATWNAVNRYFFQRGVSYWRSNPGHAAELFLRKLYWFITGQVSSDIYFPQLEIEQGLAPWLRAAPLPLPWLILPALIGLTWMAVRPRRYGAELILFLIPLLIVALFWYSPRYRLPALPILVIASAGALARTGVWRKGRAWPLAACAALALGIGLQFVNGGIGFDSPTNEQRASVWFSRGWTLERMNRPDEALVCYQRALELRPDCVEAAADLGNLYVVRGQLDEAETYLNRALKIDPRNAVIYDQLGRVLVGRHRLDDALRMFETAVRLNPDIPELHINLANTCLQLGRSEEAAQEYEAVLRLDPNSASAHYNLGALHQQRGDNDGALRHYRAALHCDPKLQQAAVAIVRLQSRPGDVRAQIDALRQANETSPRDSRIANELAWLLATSPNLTSTDRVEALRLARGVVAAGDLKTPEVFDTLAAALAANGRFAEAVQTLERVLPIVEQRGATEMAERFRTRLALYKAGKPYVVEPQSGTP